MKGRITAILTGAMLLAIMFSAVSQAEIDYSLYNKVNAYTCAAEGVKQFIPSSVALKPPDGDQNAYIRAIQSGDGAVSNFFEHGGFCFYARYYMASQIYYGGGMATDCAELYNYSNIPTSVAYYSGMAVNNEYYILRVQQAGGSAGDVIVLRHCP